MYEKRIKAFRSKYRENQEILWEKVINNEIFAKN